MKSTKANVVASKPLPPDLLEKIDAYWRAANDLSVGQIYLYDNPLLKQPLTLEHVKPRLLGHWGTTPGLNFLYAHLNRVIKQHDLNAIHKYGQDMPEIRTMLKHRESAEQVRTLLRPGTSALQGLRLPTPREYAHLLGARALHCWFAGATAAPLTVHQP
jgi:hypothetical protein